MKATILPWAILYILTKSRRAVVSIIGQGEYGDLSTAFEVFLIFSTQL